MITIKSPVLYEIMTFAGARFKVHQTFSRCHRVGHVTLITTRSFVFVIRIFGELNLLQTCVLNIAHMRSISVMCSIMCSMCHVPASATVFWHTVSIGVDFEFHCGSSSPFRHACDQATLECGR